jgi:hypothetical protein
LRLVAIAAGGTLLAIDAFATAGHVQEAEGGVTALVIAALAVAISSTVLLLVLEHALAEKRAGYALGAGLAFVLSVAFMVSGTLERTASAQEAQAAAARAANQGAVLARQALEAARAELAKAEAEAGAARNAGGCGMVCRSWEEAANAARVRLAAAEQAVKDAGAERAIAAGPSRIAKIIGVDTEAVETWLPLLLPLALQAGALALLGWGFVPAASRASPVPAVRSFAADTVERPATFEAAAADLQAILAAGGAVPEQRLLAARWGVSEGCVSKWLARMDGIERPKSGKARAVVAA